MTDHQVPSPGEFLLYETEDGRTRVECRFAEDSLWLSQAMMAELFQTSPQNMTLHLKALYSEGEIAAEATCKSYLQVRSEGDRRVRRTVKFYNLDAILAVGYRVRSQRGTQFRRWATERLREYLVKGFAMDDARLKNLGGGSYFKELLDRIREIRSDEKVMYRQVLDLYATATDYDPRSATSIQFFKIVQNKLHYAAHGHTASEVIYLRVDSDKPFAGLTSFKGSQPTQAEAMVAKNYLSEKELRVLNNLVSAYFDFAELNAIEERAMRMADFVRELDTILSSAGRKVLQDSGKVSNTQAQTKAKQELQKYKGKTLAAVEEDYLKTINMLEKTAKSGSKKKEGKA